MADSLEEAVSVGGGKGEEVLAAVVWVVAAWEAVVSAAAGLVEEAMAMAMAATEAHRLVGAGVEAERVETSELGEVVTVAVV